MKIDARKLSAAALTIRTHRSPTRAQDYAYLSEVAWGPFSEVAYGCTSEAAQQEAVRRLYVQVSRVAALLEEIKEDATA